MHILPYIPLLLLHPHLAVLHPALHEHPFIKFATLCLIVSVFVTVPLRFNIVTILYPAISNHFIHIYYVVVCLFQHVGNIVL